MKKKGWKLQTNLWEAVLTWQQRWKKAESLDTVSVLSAVYAGKWILGPVTGARLRFAGTPLGDVAPIYLCKNRTGHCCDNKDPDCFTPGGCFCDSSCRAFGKSHCFILAKIVSGLIRVERRTSRSGRDDMMFSARTLLVQVLSAFWVYNGIR